MHTIKEIGFRVKHALENGDLEEFGRLQDEALAGEEVNFHRYFERSD